MFQELSIYVQPVALTSWSGEGAVPVECSGNGVCDDIPRQALSSLLIERCEVGADPPDTTSSHHLCWEGTWGVQGFGIAGSIIVGMRCRLFVVNVVSDCGDG